ncbi:Thiamin-phosphate pyrophosphorylase [Candidatus Syntrophocurvum alkaliphilum]|uniref:Thiamine-phosphate synthase n=1 Tax=Candidatus Syntrophocurvum alkaliphilum TaxID=2293317 RepID=A0A6I6DP77_9FIRM|nr:thiamine phosphate synthase [Candidatus Syntrophocurvum alkaliphilum]QGU00678.1 Thiamin-phosphate pyrophosphorylase [Candidatus Syntrophocurvum alkaliphilum]
MMLYLVTNRHLIKEDNLLNVVKKSVEAGANAVILREKDLNFEELYPITMEIKKVTEKNNALLIVNNNLDVAIKSKADGYHSSFKDFINASKHFPRTKGVSIHSVEEAIIAENNGADYLLAGHVYKTDSKKDLEPKGLEFIRNIKAKVNIPVIAIGGITPQNAKEVINAGADGIAVMSSIMSSKDTNRIIKEYQGLC